MFDRHWSTSNSKLGQHSYEKDRFQISAAECEHGRVDPSYPKEFSLPSLNFGSAKARESASNLLLLTGAG